MKAGIARATAAQRDRPMVAEWCGRHMIWA